MEIPCSAFTVLLLLLTASITTTAFFVPNTNQIKNFRLQFEPISVSSKKIAAVHKDTNILSLSFFNRQKSAPEQPAAIPGIGPDGCALPSPSEVNTLSEPIQASIVLGIFAGIGLSSVLFSNFLEYLTLSYTWVPSWKYTWPLLGVIYAAAGVTHFTLSEDYENIYPTKGAWGIWYLPGTPKFHVAWTGVAELLGGIGLLIGGAYDAYMPVWDTCPNILTNAGVGSDAAVGLLLLTIAVTPANIFMYTHGAKLPMEGPEVPVVGHFVRGVMQVLLLGLLYQMGQGTFEELF